VQGERLPSERLPDDRGRPGLPSPRAGPTDGTAVAGTGTGPAGDPVADLPVSFDEAAAAHAVARERVRATLADLTDDELTRVCTAVPAPGRPEESRPVARCLQVVLDEHVEHRRHELRDLAVLQAR
jgi:hypothetical protein